LKLPFEELCCKQFWFTLENYFVCILLKLIPQLYCIQCNVDLNCSRYAIALVTSAFNFDPVHLYSKFFAAFRLHLVVLHLCQVNQSANTIIITIFVQKMTLPPHSLVSSQTDTTQLHTSRSPCSGPSSKRKRNSRNGTSDSVLRWSFSDHQPSLCLSFLKKMVKLQQWMTAAHHLIFFSFLPRIYDKTYQNRNKQILFQTIHGRTGAPYESLVQSASQQEYINFWEVTHEEEKFWRRMWVSSIHRLWNITGSFMR
jgi:hypothetical protein